MAYGLLLSKRVEINIFQNGWREDMHTPHSTPLDPPLAMSYKIHQKSLAYFSHLAQLILLFFTRRQSQKERTGGGEMAQRPPTPKE